MVEVTMNIPHSELLNMDSNANNTIEKEESRIVKLCLVKYKCFILLIILLMFMVSCLYFFIARVMRNEEVINLLLIMFVNNTTNT